MERTEDGLLLAPLRQFKLTQKAILVPWSDVVAEPSRAMFQSAAALTFVGSPGIRLRVIGTMGTQVLEAVASRKSADA